MVKNICNKKTLKTCGTVALCLLKFMVLMFLADLSFGVITELICTGNFHLSENISQIISGDVGDVGIIILGYVYYKFNNESMLEDCEIRKTRWSYVIKSFFIGICMVAISSILNTIIMKTFNLHSDTYNHVKEIYNIFSSNILFLYSPLIIAPICEELLCRGMLFHRLQKIVNVKLAIVIQAIFFACLHGNIIQFAYTFLMGIIAGCLVYYTRSIISSMIFHFANNLFALVISGVIGSNNIVKVSYMILASIVCLYLLWNIRKCSRLNIA